MTYTSRVSSRRRRRPVRCRFILRVASPCTNTRKSCTKASGRWKRLAYDCLRNFHIRLRKRWRRYCQQRPSEGDLWARYETVGNRIRVEIFNYLSFFIFFPNNISLGAHGVYGYSGDDDRTRSTRSTRVDCHRRRRRQKKKIPNMQIG